MSFARPTRSARALARDVAARWPPNPRLVLGLPTGRTPIPLYRELVRLHRAGRADFSRATTFNLDEFLGLRAARSAQLPRVHAAASVRSRQPAAAADPLPERRARATSTRECRRYERAIARAGGIDLQILGLGDERPHRLQRAGARAGRAHAPHAADAGDAARQRGAVRRTASAPCRARRCRWGWRRFCGRGGSCCWRPARRRRGASQRMIEGPVTPRLPASFLQLHRRVGDLARPRGGARARDGLTRAAGSADPEQFLQARLDVLADRVADEVVRACAGAASACG